MIVTNSVKMYSSLSSFYFHLIENDKKKEINKTKTIFVRSWADEDK